MNPPTLYAVCGLPGTGKTCYARRLAALTGAERLSRDELRTTLFDRPDFSAEEKRRVFDRMIELARERLTAGRDVILEGMPFSRRAERDRVRALADECSASCRLVLCVCSDRTAMARIAAAPGHPARDRSPDLYLAVKARFEPLGPDEPHQRIVTE